MDWHVLVVFGAIFSASLTQCFPITFEARTREKRSPQDQGLFFQTRGSLNLGGLNIPQVASNVRKRLHDLVDTVTNPLNIQIVSQVDPVNVNYEYDQQYDYVDQQYQNNPSFRPRGPPHGGPPHGPPPQGPPHEHHSRDQYHGPPRDHHHGPPPRDHNHGPPPRDHHQGPPPRDHHGPPPRDHHGPPPRDHHGPPPRDHHHGPPPRDHNHGPPPRDHDQGPPPRDHHHGPPPRGPPPRGPPPRGPPSRGPPPPPIYYEDPSSEDPINDNANGDNQNVPETKPDFSQQPNYPGKGPVNIELSSSSPPTTSSLNLDEVNTKKSSNVSGYIDDFPVILLTENEIR